MVARKTPGACDWRAVCDVLLRDWLAAVVALLIPGIAFAWLGVWFVSRAMAVVHALAGCPALLWAAVTGLDCYACVMPFNMIMLPGPKKAPFKQNKKITVQYGAFRCYWANHIAGPNRILKMAHKR